MLILVMIMCHLIMTLNLIVEQKRGILGNNDDNEVEGRGLVRIGSCK